MFSLSQNKGNVFCDGMGLVPEDQTIYCGLVKSKEANHDASLYRPYQKAAGEIERNGGKVLRVQLGYELKEKLYRKLGKAQASGEGRNQRSKLALADQLHLAVVNGKVAFADVRIEYANQEMETYRYLETEDDKVGYFCRDLGIARARAICSQLFPISRTGTTLRR
jgi:hypothetical protein